jgi:catechol 2,3-dioxygenase-like lactoylglutathione lyase family enzyme
MKVETVDFLTIPTRDVERSVAFYRDVLGFAPSEYNDAEVETPNVTISFWNPLRDGEQFTPHVGGFAIRVADVEEARRELEAKGVTFKSETYDSGVCHMGFLEDPDGNTIILHRRYKPREQG